MIEIIIRMNVNGESKQYYPLGKLEIINLANNTNHPKKGNYAVKIYSKAGHCFKKKIIMNHPRLAESVWSLLRKALAK